MNKIIFSVLTSLLLLPLGLEAQEAYCPFEATATGGGYYRVLVDGNQVSQHTRLDQAMERAAQEETVDPSVETIIDHDFSLRIECPVEVVEEPTDTVVEEPTDTTSTDPTAALYATDFEEFAVGTRLQDTGVQDSGFQWLGGPYADVQPSPDGSGHALAFYYGPTEPNGNSHWWSEQNFDLGAEYTDLWIEFYVWFPEGFQHENADGSSANNKLLALWADDYQSEPLLAYQFWPGATNDTSYVNLSRTLGDLDGDRALTRYPDHTINRGVLVRPGDGGQWIQVRVHTKIATYGQSDGAHELWVDGVKAVDVQDDPYYDEAGDNNYVRRGYLMGYDNGRYSEALVIHLDDVSFHVTDPGW